MKHEKAIGILREFAVQKTEEHDKETLPGHIGYYSCLIIQELNDAVSAAIAALEADAKSENAK